MMELAKIRRPLIRILLGFWLAAFVATHLPPLQTPGGLAGDKTMHLLGYFVLSGLFVLVLRSMDVSLVNRFLLTFLVFALYGAFDELTQPLVGRSASLGDWTADILGATLACLPDALWFRYGAKQEARSGRS